MPDYILLAVLLSIVSAQQSQLWLQAGQISALMISKGGVQPNFIRSASSNCKMPDLFVLPDNRQSYTIRSEGVVIRSIEGNWHDIRVDLSCGLMECIANINNNCQQSTINSVTISTDVSEAEYLVDCSPDIPYRPFQTGLFVLILFCTVVITLSSIFSKAWSYTEFAIDINMPFILAFNLFFLLMSVLTYVLPLLAGFILNVIGSILGTVGVTICSSQLIWLFKCKALLRKLYRKVRFIDLISASIGLTLTILFWVLDGEWIINDVLAVCSIVGIIKIFKIRSLYLGTVLIFSLLLLEIVLALLVHFFMEISYNNFIISNYSSPIAVVFPSITHQLHRKCAWLPLTALCFPGLVLSYLRRFDISRGTYVYFLIGLMAFYWGSMGWMIANSLTPHSLPFAIVSQPVTLLVLWIISMQRNDFKILWKGNWYDVEIIDGHTKLLKEHRTESEPINSSVILELTGNLVLDQEVQPK